MVAGYILIGTFAGLLTSLGALLSGFSFLVALGLYCLVSVTLAILLPVVQVAVQAVVSLKNDRNIMHHVHGKGNAGSIKLVLSQIFS